MKRLLARLATLTNDGPFTTVYCGACGSWQPIGHGCQGGNSR
jgi:hypothetical protein